VADGWCWFVLREKYCWLVADDWFVLRQKYCWLVADKPNEQGERLNRVFFMLLASVISNIMAHTFDLMKNKPCLDI
jgi:hypothetical protein